MLTQVALAVLSLCAGTSERGEGWITLGGYANIMSLRPCLCADAAHGLFDHLALSFCGSRDQHYNHP
jgi:hypothetical protein